MTKYPALSLAHIFRTIIISCQRQSYRKGVFEYSIIPSTFHYVTQARLSLLIQIKDCIIKTGSVTNMLVTTLLAMRQVLEAIRMYLKYVRVIYILQVLVSYLLSMVRPHKQAETLCPKINTN